MKIHKLILASLAAIAIASSASATVVINFTGSSAFRAAIQDALANGGVFTAAPTYTWRTNSGATATIFNCDEAVFHGSITGISDPDVYVRTSWNGSVEGVEAVAQPGTFPTNFIPTSALPGSNGVQYFGSVEVGVPKMAMSDVYQASTPITTPSMTDHPEGVVTFVWVSDNNAPTPLNMTTQIANNILGNGTVSLALFTGASTDSTKTVYLTGRYNGSGTRATALAETAYGVFNPIVQYYPITSGVHGNITSLQIWPSSSFNPAGVEGVDLTAGNGGFTSGGHIVTPIGSNMIAGSNNVLDDGGNVIGSTNATDVLVSYLGTGDAANANGSGTSHYLTYNGGTYSVANVENGSYTFWGYEHLLFITLSADETTFVNQLEAQLPASISGKGVGLTLSAMNVARGNDGGLVSPK